MISQLNQKEMISQLNNGRIDLFKYFCFGFKKHLIIENQVNTISICKPLAIIYSLLFLHTPFVTVYLHLTWLVSLRASVALSSISWPSVPHHHHR